MNMLRKLKKDVKAVSPVIATLMMVLVAVGSAGALYAWQTGWMDSATGDLGSAGARKTLTIDGSSTVYEFSVVAAKMYEAQNPDTKISVTVTGSGAGREAARTGRVDIGSASSTTDPDDPDNAVDLDGNGPDIIGKLLVTTVAKDGVTMVTNNMDSTFTDISKHNLTIVYMFGLDIWTNWTEIRDNLAKLGNPSSYVNDTNGNGAIEVDELIIGSTNTNEIGVGVRDHESGTQECFTSVATYIKAITGEKQLGDVGEGTKGTEDVSGAGNSELMDAIEGATGPVLSFCSLAEIDASVAAGSGVVKLKFEGVEAKDKNIADGTYEASRPLEYLTIDMDENGELDPGLARDYIEFCLIPEINDAVCTESGYTSLYA